MSDLDEVGWGRNISQTLLKNLAWCLKTLFQRSPNLLSLIFLTRSTSKEGNPYIFQILSVHVCRRQDAVTEWERKTGRKIVIDLIMQNNTFIKCTSSIRIAISAGSGGMRRRMTSALSGPPPTSISGHRHRLPTIVLASFDWDRDGWSYWLEEMIIFQRFV